MDWRHLETFGDTTTRCRVVEPFARFSRAFAREVWQIAQKLKDWNYISDSDLCELETKKETSTNIGEKCLDKVQAPRCSSEVKSTENGTALYLP